MGSHLFPHLIKSFGIVGIVCRLKSPAFVVIRRQSSLRFSLRSWGLIQNTLKTQSHHLKLLAGCWFPVPKSKREGDPGNAVNLQCCSQISCGEVMYHNFFFSFTVNSLLNSNISILIGPMETSAVVATHPLCSRAGVPQIAPLTSLERIPVGITGSNYLLRMSPTEKLKAKVLAEIIKYYKWETMAVVGYQDDQGKVCILRLMKSFDCYKTRAA